MVLLVDYIDWREDVLIFYDKGGWFGFIMVSVEVYMFIVYEWCWVGGVYGLNNRVVGCSYVG